MSSPLERAVETATLIGKQLGLTVTTDERLIEARSQLEGLHRMAFLHPRQWPMLWNPTRPSWGEPFAEIAARMRAVIAEVRAAHAGAAVVLVSHQSPIWLARHSYESTRPPWLSRVRCGHASITSLRFAGDRFAGSTYWAP